MADPGKPNGYKIPIEAQLTSPGPLAYNLKRTLGTSEHDVTMKKDPAWSMGLKYKDDIENPNLNPGPSYNYGDRITHRGRAELPSYTLTSRAPLKPLEITPGPGSYADNSVRPGVISKEANPKAATMGAREAWYKEKNWAPASSKYSLPSPLGSGTSTMRGAAQWSMYGRKEHGSPYYEGMVQKRNPGPAAYSSTENSVFKKRSASYTIQGRTQPKDYNSAKHTPGPGSYNPSLPRTGKNGSSMGVRHSPYTVLCLTMADVQV